MQVVKSLLRVLALSLALCGAAHAGFTLGIGANNGPAGWSTFSDKSTTTGTCSAATADGSCWLYIDSTCGGGSCNCQLTTAGDLTHLCQTWSTARATYCPSNICRANHADRIVFREGDTQNSVMLTDDGNACCSSWSGSGPFDLMVIGSYDPNNPTVVSPGTGGNRPVLNTISNGQHVIQCQGGSGSSACNYLAIVNLKFYPKDCDPFTTGRPANCNVSSGFFTINPNPFVLIEGNDYSLYANSGCVLPQPGDAAQNPGGQVIVRRNVVANCLGQGIEAGAGGTLLVEENFVDKNGFVAVATSGTITQASPAVVTWPNAMSLAAVNPVTFSSAGGGISTGTEQSNGCNGTCYSPVNNNSTTFNLATVINSQTGNTNSSTTISGVNVAGMLVGDGVNCAACGSTTSSPCTISSIGASSFVMNCTASNTASQTITTFHQSDKVNTSAGLVSPQTITWAVDPPSAFVHNMYLGAGGNADVPVAPPTVRYNVLAEDTNSIQWRPGGTAQYNAFILNASSYVVGMMAGQPTLVDNNIFLANHQYDICCSSDPFETMHPNYQGDPTFGSIANGPQTLTVTNNIVANSADNPTNSIAILNGFTVTHGNNTAYNFNAPSLFSTAGGDGGIQAAHVASGGTGYHDSTIPITGVVVDPQNPSTNNTALTVGTTIGVVGESWGYVTGLTNSGGTCALNNHPWKITVINGTTILTSVPFSTSHCSGTGTLALSTIIITGDGTGSTTISNIPSTAGIFPGFVIGGVTASPQFNFYAGTVISVAANSIVVSSATGSGLIGFTWEITPIVNLTGGSGTGASTGYISSGGSIVFANIYGSDSGSAGVNPQPGTGYKNTDTGLSFSGVGGSGVLINVDAVSKITDQGTDRFNPGTGNTTYNFPGCTAPSAGTSPLNCTAGKYLDFITGIAGHSDTDYLAAAKAVWQKSTWSANTNLTNVKTGIIPWIQAGFGGGAVRGLGLGRGLITVPALEWLRRRPANDNILHLLRRAS